MKTKKDFSKLPKKSEVKKEREKHIIRLVKLIITLNQGVLNLDEIAQECNVSKRTILRDIKILEDAGIPLYKPSERESNYRITEDYSLPHFNVTPENALEFADALDALSSVGKKPFKMIEPVQKSVVELGRKQQKIRKEKHSKFELVPTDITQEQFFSLWLYEQNMKTDPYLSLLMMLEVGGFFDNKERRNMYHDWQIKNVRRSLLDLYYLGQQYQNVLDECNELIKEDAKDLWAYKRAALACYANKDFKGGIKYILDAMEQDKKDTELFVYLIALLIETKDYDGAITFFNFLYKDEYPKAHFASVLYKKAGMFDKALEILDRAVKKDPKHADKYKEMKADISAQQNAKK